MRFAASLIIIYQIIKPFTICAQEPISDFNAPPTACLNESIEFANASQNADSYVWDFCQSDLASSPGLSTAQTFQTATTHFYHSNKIVYSGGQWYGFVTDMNGKKIYRVDFGNSLDNNPSAPLDLGLSTTTFSSPGPIDLIKLNGIWYGLVGNIFQNNIIRLTFGNGLNSNPTLVENLGNFSNSVSGPAGIEIVNIGGQYFCFISNFAGNYVTLIQYGSSILNTPLLIKKVGVSSILTSPYGITFANKNGNYYILTGSFSTNKVFVLNFGSDLLADPAISEIITGFATGVEIDFATEGGNDYAFVRSQSSGIYRINFEANLTNPTVTNLNLSSAQSRSFTLIRTSPTWRAFTIDAAAGVFRRIDFIGNCSSIVSKNYSFENIPTDVFYKQPGDNMIELTAWATDNLSVIQKSIAIQNFLATGITINSNGNECVDGTIEFYVASQATLTNFDWDFGDSMGSSSVQSPTYQYAASGTYQVTLSATEQNGCNNNTSFDISVYAAPIPDFDLPSLSGMSCTLQEYSFINKTAYNPNSTITWGWSINGEPTSIQSTLATVFSSVGTYSVSLTASIPGCSNNISKDFDVDAEGNIVNFNFANLCWGDETQFTNTTAGTIQNYNWDFGDGNISTDEDPIHMFQNIGFYNVSLQATNSAGCVNSKTQNIVITSTPQPNFYLDLPPFSCAGSPTQFHDNTPGMPDSNITSWLWKFNDGTGETALTKDPTHIFSTAGNYNVDLEVETNYGCQSAVTLPVTISSSPTADFTIGPSCLDKTTTFTNTSSTGIQSSNWIISGNPFSTTNASYTFSNVGTYSASLTVKGSNQCENTKVKPIEVKPVPALDFNTTAVCATKETTFSDNSSGPDLPVSWNWNFGSGNLATGSPTTYSFPSVGIFPVEMSVITEAGCSYSFSKNISVATPPIASFTTTTSFGPPPLLVQFNSTSSNASALMWNFKDPAASSSSVPNPLFTFTELGDYDVELTAFNSVGCSDTFSKTVNVLIPIIDLSLDDLKVQNSFSSSAYLPVLTIANHSNVNISDITAVINGSSGTRISINLPVNLSVGGTGEFILPLELRSNDDYLCVEIIAVDDSDSSNNVQCLNLSNRTIIIHPYPNPSGSNITFEALLPEAGNGSLRILDSKGRLVFKNEFPSMIAGMNQLQINISDIEPGLYLAIWIINGQKSEVKFLKQ